MLVNVFAEASKAQATWWSSPLKIVPRILDPRLLLLHLYLENVIFEASCMFCVCR